MHTYNVEILEPGIKDSLDFTPEGHSKAVWESQYSACVLIEPPISIGSELGTVIGGRAGNIAITEVMSTEDETLVIVACAKGRSSHRNGAGAVQDATERLDRYLNTHPQDLGTLAVEFAQAPLLADHFPGEI